MTAAQLTKTDQPFPGTLTHTVPLHSIELIGVKADVPEPES